MHGPVPPPEQAWSRYGDRSVQFDTTLAQKVHREYLARLSSEAVLPQITPETPLTVKAIRDALGVNP